jgi:preprotein translocase subunit SecF
MEKNQIQAQQHNKNWYDKTFKWALLLPAIFLIISLVYLVGFYHQNGDVIYKDVSLTGGTTISIFDEKINLVDLTLKLQEKYSDVLTRGIENIRTGGIEGVIVETKATPDEIKPVIEEVLGYKLTSLNSSVEFTGSTLSTGFYQQLISAIIAAFLLMAWVVFLIFSDNKKMKSISTMLSFLGVALVLYQVSTIKSLSGFAIFIGLVYGLFRAKQKGDRYWILGVGIVSYLIYFMFLKEWILAFIGVALAIIYIIYSIPSFAVILSAFADIIMTVAVVDYVGMPLSIAGVIAFLMLIGYSVDTDIMLTSRVMKEHEGTINQRTWGAFKTGITMTLTAIAAVGVSLIFIYNFSDTLRQIFTIILIGLGFDIFNTWVTNASMLKWYMEVKKI